MQMSNYISAYKALARPKHWLKNILIFVPLVYSNNLTNFGLFVSTTMCFAAFCFISSGVYVVNDIIDVEQDRRHPAKNKRPIASGQVGKRTAVVFAIILFLLGLCLTIWGYSSYLVLLFAVLYVFLNLAYSFFLKHCVIVDCFCIAAGFILRIYAGGSAINGRISEWLLLTMTAAALFMAFGKRRGEIIQVADTTTRNVLANYDLQFLNGMVFVCAGLSVVFYSLWAMVNISAMVYTVPLIIFIICKYLLIIHGGKSYGDPMSVILEDKTLVVAIGIFGFLSILLLYL